MLGENGIFGTAKNAASNYTNAQEVEKIAFDNFENEIREHIVSTRNVGNFSLQDCIIEITGAGNILVKKVNNLIGFAIIVDGKCIDIAKGNQYQLVIPVDQTVNVYVIAIDENAVLYKSNSVSYTSNAVYIYNAGNEFTEMTSGWIFNKASYSNRGDETDCIHAIRWADANGGWSISTQQAVDVSDYSYLCCRYKMNSDNRVTSEDCWFALNNSVLPIAYTASYHTVMNLYDTENAICKWDISSINGEYYIGFITGGATDTYIYSVWFE